MTEHGSWSVFYPPPARGAPLTGGRAFLAACLGGAVPLLVLRALLLFGIGPWASYGLPLIVALVALSVGAPSSLLLLFPKHRRRAATYTGFGIGLFAGILFAEIAGSRIRMKAFELATKRAQPIVEAVERFEALHGHPPHHLRDLVPELLDELPARTPPLEIHAVSQYPPNRWLLKADTPHGIMDFDELLYLPHGNYDEFDWGGRIERLGRWGYLHE